MSTMTAEELFQDLKTMPSDERVRFFSLLAINAFGDQNMSHAQLFGHLAEDEFTAHEACEYLEVSMSTFRRYVQDGRITPSSEIGRNQLFATRNLKIFKRALKDVKRTYDDNLTSMKSRLPLTEKKVKSAS